MSTDTAPATITVPVAQARGLTDALAALDIRVRTARASLDEATRMLDAEQRGDLVRPDVLEDLRLNRHRAWARLTEVQECVATVERFLTDEQRAAG